MANGIIDPRFPSLTFHVLAFYFLVTVVTLGITIGSVVRQVGVFRSHCSYNVSYYTDTGSALTQTYGKECIAGDIVVFAIGLFAAFIGFTLASLQLYLFYTRRLPPMRLVVTSSVVMVLWIIVIAIGWNPTNATYDETTGSSTYGISGWLYTYSGYWDEESVSGGIGPTLALAMGFAVMSIVSFGLVTMIALYAFIIYHRNWRKQARLEDEAALAPAQVVADEKTAGAVREPEKAVLPTIRPTEQTNGVPEITPAGGSDGDVRTRTVWTRTV